MGRLFELQVEPVGLNLPLRWMQALLRPEGKAWDQPTIHTSTRHLLGSPVSNRGLRYFAPDQCGRTEASRQVLAGPMTWIEIARDDARFSDFLQGVIRLLDGPLPPPDRENCDWCKYRERTAGFVTEQSGTTSQPKTAMLPKCPQCQAPMRRRTGKRGEFWGCSNFPNCRGTREI